MVRKWYANFSDGLSFPKMSLMGLQHLFAMFGATIMVPLLTGLDVQVTLLAMGVGTLIFHVCAKGKVPAFLGSSFAIMAGIRLITASDGIFAGMGMTQQEKLAYATGAVLCTAAVYLILALVVKLVGVRKFMKFVPPVVTAPTVILIGTMLAPHAITESNRNILLAALTLVIIIALSTWGKGMPKIASVLLGIIGAYTVALVLNAFGFSNPDGSAILGITESGATVPVLDYLRNANIVGVPNFMMPRFNWMAIVIMLPFAFATAAEHIGDMVALKNITGKDFIEEPGLTRTLVGDGLASAFSGLIGGPGNTTYGENVGVVALTKVHNPRVIQMGAFYAIILGFSPIIAALIRSIPGAIIGGASFMLYGMIAAVGLRNLVDARVDMSKTKNLTIVAVMLIMGIGLRFGPNITFAIGETNVPIGRMGLAIAVVLGVILNAILPEEKEQNN
jgi:uracil permease